jgi:hypothetical protein
MKGILRVEVEILIIAGCPSGVAIGDLMRRLPDEAGFAQTIVRTTVIATQDDAEQRAFPGSPTVLLDGHDASPEAGLFPAFACRIYQNSDGPIPLPEQSQLREAIRLAATITPLRTGHRTSEIRLCSLGQTLNLWRLDRGESRRVV